MSTITPRDYYKLIETAVQVQIDRLLIHEASFEEIKGQRIMGALDRLYRAILSKYPDGVDIPHRYTILTKISARQVAKLNLSTIDEMLDARISHWENEREPWSQGDMDFPGRSAGYRKQMSLRTALNIARYNFFNLGDSSWGPLWGKSRALKQVERQLFTDY